MALKVKKGMANGSERGIDKEIIELRKERDEMVEKVAKWRGNPHAIPLK